MNGHVWVSVIGAGVTFAPQNEALFYPLNPRDEDKSWEQFFNEASERFFSGTYAGDYEAQLIAEFETYLPEIPPWKR
ncbi:hypothetical protein HQ563_16050 [bacterium]|nr:hypothetical protein [bacterium]